MIVPDALRLRTPVCIVGVSGYSGAGKTTLIEQILPVLKKEGLSIGVIKHVHHNLSIDIRGKDTDRFFRAGADYIFAHDALQGFLRGRYHEADLADILQTFPRGIDLAIVEGHKGFRAPGIWLEKRDGKTSKTAKKGGGKKVIFRDEPGYLDKALNCILEEVKKFHSERPLRAGLLIGGKSRRMGSPKTLLKVKGRTLARKSFGTLSEVSEKVVLLGSGQIPKSLNKADRLPDALDVKGPMAGMLTAFRWAPESSWIISSIDLPLMCKEAWEWLLDQRRPGVWAVLPKRRRGVGVETTGGVYEPMIFSHVEALAAKGKMKLQEIARHPKVITPLIPKSIECAWSNANTPSEWKKILGLSDKAR